MKNIRILLILGTFTALLLGNCTTPELSKASTNLPKKMVLPSATEPYWFDGSAEIAVYAVQQERYGEMRPARQVMVFVTEDFSKNKQVKLDDPEAAPNDRQPILKLNLLRRFTTGIYDYSLMQSIFTPFGTDNERSLKTTTTVQDWCGQVYSQYNRKPKGDYQVQSFSYFESEGDDNLELQADFLEDEIWTQIRLNPRGLENFSGNVAPADFYNRLKHKPLKPHLAKISIQNNAATSTLLLQYESIDRSLSIQFESLPPHRILSWEEKTDGKIQSSGQLVNLSKSPYWTKSSHQFDSLRDSIGLKWF